MLQVRLQILRLGQAFRDLVPGGPGPVLVLKELRLQRAALLLQTTSRPIKSIADQIGFESRSHFSRSFTDFFGTTPADFRNKPQ